MAARTIFVTGTDTGVGKTLIAAALIHKLARQGRKVVGMKPVASGSIMAAGTLRNDDALALMAEASVEAPYELVNPYCFAPAIAPHIAAAQAGTGIEMAVLHKAHTQLAAHAEFVVVEGAGGWLTPLNARETLADFPVAINSQVVLVVGMRLGCINHALLTARAIDEAGLGPCGWIANMIDPQMQQVEENIQALQQRLLSPLGIISHTRRITPQQCADSLRLPD